MPAAVLAKGTPAEQQTATLAAAAMGLLRRNLKEPFDLSLINLGASNFSEGTAAAAAGTRDIASMLGGARRSTEAAEAAAGEAVAGLEQQQPQRQQQQSVPPQRQQQPPPATGRAVAAASAEQRRSYSAAPQQAPLLSKRQERQLREQPQQPQQTQQTQQAQQLPAATWQGVPAGPQALQQAQQACHAANHARRPQRGMDEWGFRDGWGEELQQEDVEDDFWGDLQSLESWHSRSLNGGSRRQPSPSAPPPSAGQANGSNGRLQPQPQLQPAAAGKPPAGPFPGSGAGAAGPAVARGSSEGSSRVVLHCDVDSFYVAVRLLLTVAALL